MSAKSVTETKCRVCSGHNLSSVLSLGQTPLANSLIAENKLTEPEDRYPLELVFCGDCSLVQITETVAPEALFSDYVYFSSFADTTLKNAEQLVTKLTKTRNLGKDSLAMEIASNDGYLLQHYLKAGVPVLGIEPAQNIAKVATERGIDTVCEFFGKQCAQQLKSQGKQADVIHGNNVLAHVADLNGVAEGIGVVLKQNGMASIEVPYVRDMVDHVEFDTIYHEHLCYFSLTALDKLFRQHKLFITDVERISIHGGSLRIFITKNDAPSKAVKELLAEEQKIGMNTVGYYANFGARVSNLRKELRELLQQLKKQGKRVAAYGASAKGSTLLNFFEIGQESMDYVVDRSTVKQGRYTPGTRFPIFPTEKLVQDMPDYCLLLTWNFADEILQQQSEYRKKGGQFIIPIPELKIV